MLFFLVGFGGFFGWKLFELFCFEFYFVLWKYFLLGFLIYIFVNNEYLIGLIEVFGGKVLGFIFGIRDVLIWFELFVVLYFFCKCNGVVELWDEDLLCSGIIFKRYLFVLVEVGFLLFFFYI